MMLEDDEKTEVSKVHRYFGHRNGRKIWELFAKAGKLKKKKKAVLELLEKCQICRKLKKTPPRPRIGMPVANTFNEVVALDLKVLNKNGEYILWMIDMFTKAIKGKYIKSKTPETIVNGLIEKWVLGDGFGPGHPSQFFYSDNGGEFLNQELIDFAATMNTNIKMTAAHSPWQNGTIERHHATCDYIFEKIMAENPKITPQEAVDQAAFAKNSETNQSGFSPLQLIMGKNPNFPGLSEVTSASTNMDNSSRALRALQNIDEARVKYRKYDCDEKLKKVRSQRINPSVEKFYNMGDPVLFRDDKKKKWIQGTALIRFGKTLYLKYGNFLRRVPIDTVIPDVVGAEREEDGFVEPLDVEEEERFEAEETSVEEVSKDLETANEVALLRQKVLSLEAVIQTVRDSKENAPEETVDESVPSVSKNDDIPDENIAGSEDDKNVKRKEKRERQKLKKMQNKKIFPVKGQMILFKDYNSTNWIKAKVFGVFKKTSTHKNIKQIELENGLQIEKDFENEVEEWKPFEDENKSEIDAPETFFLSSILGKEQEVKIDDVYSVETLKKSEYGNPEVKDAMYKEIEKFKQFEAIEEVDDMGQDRIPIRWVVTKHEIDAKNQPLKARLCVRGDLESGKNNVRSDSPTAGKDTLKLALLVAANEGFRVKSGDKKAAYLQGLELQREVHVTPPTEAGVEDGKIWRLKKAAYGLLDGGRMFYLRLVQELDKLGMQKVHTEGALWTYVKNGKLKGLILSHVDDFLLIGNDTFEEDIEEKLKITFKFSKIEQKSFKYCGCNININEKGVVELDQNDYVDKLELVPRKEGDVGRALEAKEVKELRGKIGEILWISLMTRPDLAFDVNVLASEVPKATVETVNKMNRLIAKAINRREVLRFVRLGDISELVVKLYTDASYNNQDGQVRSTEGRVVLIENPKEKLVSVASWKTRKIPRVCRSVKSAETRALEDGLDEAVHTARVISEIYSGIIDLKNPDQLPVLALTDSKSLWESLHNTKQCEEKLLRNTIAGIKELMNLKMVQSVEWVSTDNQLADCMTKTGIIKKADWLLLVAKTNNLMKN